MLFKDPDRVQVILDRAMRFGGQKSITGLNRVDWVVFVRDTNLALMMSKVSLVEAHEILRLRVFTCSGSNLVYLSQLLLSQSGRA